VVGFSFLDQVLVLGAEHVGRCSEERSLGRSRLR
jgi:hypothetical protein